MTILSIIKLIECEKFTVLTFIQNPKKGQMNKNKFDPKIDILEKQNH